MCNCGNPANALGLCFTCLNTAVATHVDMDEYAREFVAFLSEGEDYAESAS